MLHEISAIWSLNIALKRSIKRRFGEFINIHIYTSYSDVIGIIHSVPATFQSFFVNFADLVVITMDLLLLKISRHHGSSALSDGGESHCVCPAHSSVPGYNAFKKRGKYLIKYEQQLEKFG